MGFPPPEKTGRAARENEEEGRTESFPHWQVPHILDTVVLNDWKAARAKIRWINHPLICLNSQTKVSRIGSLKS